jgi:signal transduction histidine kinase
VITWTAVVLFIILCGGFFLMYRLGARQISLSRQQQDFVSAVSHELKTPLTSIRMYGEMLREGWAPDEKKKSYYDFIYHESERLSRLIQNILQLARMTRNELTIEPTNITLSELIDTIRSKVTSQVERNDFKLKLECDEALLDKKLYMDTDYFSQIIINLVDNAIKFSKDSEIKQIDIKCSQPGKDRISFHLRDYGPGIDKSQLRKIFTLFYRTENELTRKTVGTGIGLALVHQLASALDGEIDVVNQEPGAEFIITFPLVDEN